MGGGSGVFITQLSKAFDCYLHDYLIAKIAHSGFDYDSLVFMPRYLPEIQERTKVNTAYSFYHFLFHKALY